MRYGWLGSMKMNACLDTLSFRLIVHQIKFRSVGVGSCSVLYICQKFLSDHRQRVVVEGDSWPSPINHYLCLRSDRNLEEVPV